MMYNHHILRYMAMIVLPLAVLAGLMALVIQSRQQVLGAFTTSVQDRSPAQVHNIELATSALDGVLVRAGEVFSFADAVGECSSDRGYLPAPTIVEGRIESAPGGGVCQVSSTLYNAALLAGMEIVERHAHTYTVRSVPPGRDAAVSSGAQDLRFRNDRSHAVKLRAIISQNRLMMYVVGRDTSNLKARILVDTKNAMSLMGRKGVRYCIATVWREIIRDGDVVRREFISSDKYVSPPEDRQ
jgi:vancomycin resistance protein VanW